MKTLPFLMYFKKKLKTGEIRAIRLSENVPPQYKKVFMCKKLIFIVLIQIWLANRMKHSFFILSQSTKSQL